MELMVEFRAQRLFLRAGTRAGRILSLLLDTGGGPNLLAREVADALGLAARPFPLDGGGTVREAVDFPPTTGDAPLPAARLPFLLSDRQAVWDGGDGLFGNTWFRDRTWLLDYPRRRVALAAPSPDGDGWRTLPIGLARATDPKGPAFPRIQATIDGECLDLLLDTGATLALSAPGRAALGTDGPALRATSFIIASRLAGWRARHADWPFVAAGDRHGGDLIRASTVTIAGAEVGPVWFTSRRDAAFLEYMSQWMDRPAVGALGGSALRHGAWHLDYPRALARFRPR